MNGGCGLLSSGHRPTAKTNSRSPVLVEVESRNWNDITVYLITGGLPQRLGMVTALGNATFKFSAHRLNTTGDVRLRALPVAGEGFSPEKSLVLPGPGITRRGGEE